MNTRLEQILINLAKQHAPHLVPSEWDKSGDAQRVARLARGLAGYDLLVMMGYIPPAIAGDAEAHIQRWVDAYGQLYHLLAGRLFPSRVAISAQYADDQLPVIIIIQGAATPVIHILAGLIAPYIATRQSFPMVSEAELLGLMDIVLDELEAGDLPRQEYNRLKVDGARILARLLECRVRQVGITPSDRPIFGRAQPFSPPPDKLPEQAARPQQEPPPPPAHVPEAAAPEPQTLPGTESARPAPAPQRAEALPAIEEVDETPSEVLFSPHVPLLPPRRKGPSGSKRRLPVPDLPPDSPPDSV